MLSCVNVCHPRFRCARLLAAGVLLAAVAACGGTAENQSPPESAPQASPAAPAPNQEGDQPMEMLLTSTAFRNGEVIPKKYTGDGADVSPPLKWTEPPEGTKSFALICDDPDAPMGTWVHWVIYNIPPGTRELPEGVPAQKDLSNGARQGINDFRKIGYNGPAPPRGSAHRYFFKLYALSSVPNLPAGASKKDLLKAMEGKILGQSELLGKYKR